jgi:hypothetical protein
MLEGPGIFFNEVDVKSCHGSLLDCLIDLAIVSVLYANVPSEPPF